MRVRGVVDKKQQEQVREIFDIIMLVGSREQEVLCVVQASTGALCGWERCMSFIS